MRRIGASSRRRPRFRSNDKALRQASLSSWRLARKAIRLPVEAVPEHVDSIGDPLELVAPVSVGGQQIVERGELGQVAKAVLGRLGHFHLTRHEAPVALAREDPEPLRRLLGEEPRLLAGRHRAEKKTRGEPDRTRGRRDEVREVAEGAKVAVPALARDQLGERRFAGHERLATPLDPIPDLRRRGIERASALVAREKDAALLEELAHRGDPERERRYTLVPRENRLGLRGHDPATARKRLRSAVRKIDLAAGERIVAAQE